MSDGCARTGMRFSGGAKRASRQGGPGREPERPGSLQTSAGVAVMIHHARGPVRPPEVQMSSIPSLVPRDRYAALARCTYLNQAALGLIPVPTIDAMGPVLLVGSDFPSVTYPGLAAAERRGISLRFVDDRADRDLTQDLVDAIDPTTAVVPFSVVQSATGTRVDARRGAGG